MIINKIFKALKKSIQKKNVLSDTATGGLNNETHEKLTQYQKAQTTIAARIIGANEKGFTTTIENGKIRAFISFNHMPWRYTHRGAWKNIAPNLTGKIVYTKIHLFIEEKNFVILNANIPQLKPIDLSELHNKKFNGIIIKKIKSGLLIDVGNFYNWSRGSIVGLLHKSFLKPEESMDDLDEGQFITVTLLFDENKNKIIFSRDTDIVDWNSREPQELIGKIVWATVDALPDENSKHVKIKVLDKYKSNLNIWFKIYSKKDASQIHAKRKALKLNDTVICSVKKVNTKKKKLFTEWYPNLPIEDLEQKTDMSTGIQNIKELIADYPNNEKIIFENISPETLVKHQKLHEQYLLNLREINKQQL